MDKKSVLLRIGVALLGFAILLGPSVGRAQSQYFVRANATGANNGSNWTDAYTALPASLQRGATYYVADGSYGYYLFDDAPSGSTLITIRKATVADHGTDVGWTNSYGDGQAVFDGALTFRTGFYVLDGNGSQVAPTNDPSKFGFKIASDSTANTGGILQFGQSGYPVSDIVVKYLHVYNTSNGSVNNGTVAVRFYPGVAQTRIKLQNCYIQNCGKDGLQISNSSFILVERCYLQRLGRKLPGTPDYHGQTVQMFWNAHDVIFRWNIWDSCEGQALVAYGDDGTTTTNLRFYGNLVFSAYNTTETAGFNTSGGLVGNSWPAAEVLNIFIYNNTVVNQRESYTSSNSTAVHFPVHASTGVVSNLYAYNNLFFNSVSSFTPRFTNSSHHASGGYGTAGGSNEQVGLGSSVFVNYTSNDFRLASATSNGRNLTGESWWRASDAFFGFLDSAADMYGNTRGGDGNWDRGAYEFVTGGVATPSPTATVTPTATATVSPTISPSGTATPLASPVALKVGDRVTVNSSPSLRVRGTPSTTATILGEQVMGALGTIVSGPVSAEGYTWWEINYDTAPDGWSIEGSGTETWLMVAPQTKPSPPSGFRVVP